MQDVAREVRADARRPRLSGLAEDVGFRGLHVNVGIHQRWTSTRCAARRWRSPAKWNVACRRLATSKWWKEERHGVSIDYSQNAKDRTCARAFRVRPRPDAARVSDAADVGEFTDVRPGRLRPLRDTMSARFSPGRRSPCGDRQSPVSHSTPARTVGEKTGAAKGRATRRGRRNSEERARPAFNPRGPAFAKAPARQAHSERPGASRASAHRHRALDKEGEGAGVAGKVEGEHPAGRRASP